jgi:calcineurin-like phosphoesterase family protein
MSRRWVIADLHFGHTNVIAYSDRPYRDADHMTEELIKNWNNVVAKDDIVYVLGDFTLSRRKEYIAELCSRLNGSKVLIMGNHDTRKPADYIECGFKVAVRRPILLEPRLVLMHEPPAREDIWYRAKYVFGHVHNKPCEADLYGNCACVSAERINYTPVDLDVLIKTMDPSRGPEFGD